MNLAHFPSVPNASSRLMTADDHESLAIILQDKTASFTLKTLDIDGLLFRKRASKATVPTEQQLTLFDEQRRYFLQGLKEYLLQLQGSAQTTSLFYYTIKVFFDWVDAQVKVVDFSKIDSVVDAYQRYSKHLVNRTLLSDTAEQYLSASTAKSYQRNVAKLIAFVFERHETDILIKAPQVQAHRSAVPILPVASAAHQKSYATLLNTFLEIYRVVVNEGNFPAHFQSTADEHFYFYSGFHHKTVKSDTQFDMQSYLTQYAEIPTLDEMLSDFGADRSPEGRKRLRENRNQALRKLKQLNQDKQHLERQRLASYGLVIGALLFIAQTGANLDTVQQLELETMQILPATQGRRFSGTKSRARGKTVQPEFGAHFEPVFKKIMALRDWYVQGEPCSLVFPARNEAQKLVSIGKNKVQIIKNFLLRIFPTFVWITPQQWRKHVSSQYVELSGGDLLLEAEKMGHSLDTARQNYVRASFKDTAVQFSEFFSNLRKVAVEKTRRVKHIPVAVIDPVVKRTNDEQILPVGTCHSQALEPVRAKEFTESAPVPNCRQFEHCLFCQHYAVHADDEDIRKLLSLKTLLQQIKQKATDLNKWEQHFGVILHRIDEVVSELSHAYTDLTGRIAHISEEVACGDLDSYWLNHFELLIELGWLA